MQYMKKHEINKAGMYNDIILTISLIISVILVELGMYLTNMSDHEYNTVIFFIASFIFIKLIYNFLLRTIRVRI